ncbi:MAG: SxtJ family membrane protein [Saonia sp.]
MMRITQKQCVETAILLAIASIGALLFYKEWVFVWPILGILMLALLFPLVFYPLAWLWFGFAKILGFVSSNVILTVTFFLLVTPISLLRKWMGKDDLYLKKYKKGSHSILKVREHQYGADDFKNTF